MKLVFLFFCMIFVITNGREKFNYGVDPVLRTCYYLYSNDYGSVLLHEENTLGDEYTNWYNKCPYENRVTVNCSNGQINPNAIIEVTEHDDWPLENDHLARFKWTKIADDGKSAYVDMYIGTEQLTDLYRDPWLELFWWFENPCSDGKNYNDRDMFKQKFVF